MNTIIRNTVLTLITIVALSGTSWANYDVEIIRPTEINQSKPFESDTSTGMRVDVLFEVHTEDIHQIRIWWNPNGGKTLVKYNPHGKTAGPEADGVYSLVDGVYQTTLKYVGVPEGERRVRVEGLDANGEPSGVDDAYDTVRFWLKMPPPPKPWAMWGDKDFTLLLLLAPLWFPPLLFIFTRPRHMEVEGITKVIQGQPVKLHIENKGWTWLTRLGTAAALPGGVHLAGEEITGRSLAHGDFTIEVVRRFLGWEGPEIFGWEISRWASHTVHLEVAPATYNYPATVVVVGQGFEINPRHNLDRLQDIEVGEDDLANDLPAWMVLDTTTGTLSGIPPVGSGGVTLTLVAQATNGHVPTPEARSPLQVRTAPLAAPQAKWVGNLQGAKVGVPVAIPLDITGDDGSVIVTVNAANPLGIFWNNAARRLEIVPHQPATGTIHARVERGSDHATTDASIDFVFVA